MKVLPDIDGPPQPERAVAEDAAALAEAQALLRTTLSLVRSLARRTAETSLTIEEFAARLDGRLDALARQQGVAGHDPWRGVGLEFLIAEELSRYARSPGRVTIVGEPVRLRSRSAQVIGLVIHELACESLAGGALSTPEGRIGVTWRIAEDCDPVRLVLTWKELCPALHEGERRVGLLLGSLAQEVRANWSWDLEPDGLRLTFSMPATDRTILAM